MSGEENGPEELRASEQRKASEELEASEELKAFEAALASLRPRADRLDPQWRDFLAKGAALTAAMLSAQGVQSSHKAAPDDGAPAWTPIYASCDQARPAAGRLRRWAWPAAFAAMTTVAATLLAMLASRPGPQIVELIVEVPVEAVPAKAAEEDRDVSQPPSLPAAPERAPMAEGFPGSQPRWAAYRRPSAAPYCQLLDRVLQRGLDAWETPAADPTKDWIDWGPSNWEMTSDPMASREMLHSLLNEPGPDGPLPPPGPNRPSTL